MGSTDRDAHPELIEWRGRHLVDLRAADLPSGTRLRRWYRGRWHEVEITGGQGPLGRLAMRRKRDLRTAQKNRWWRYKYEGRHYKTLSAIAREITGDPTMSGNRFFGLRARRS